MRRVLLAGAATLALVAAAPQGAQALVMTTTPVTNDVMGGGVKGWLGATWYLIAGAATLIDVYYLGVEAGADNSFTLNTLTYGPVSGNTGLSSLFGGTTAPLFVGSSLTMPGLLNFQFDTSIGPATVTNAANPTFAVPRFFSYVVTCGSATLAACFGGTGSSGSYAYSGDTLLLALDDGGGGPDADFDDMVMIIRLSNGLFSIPEPASLALLGAGLLGLGFAARRRRAG